MYTHQGDDFDCGHVSKTQLDLELEIYFRAHERLFMDRKYETIILPFFGCPAPFHISTIKNCSSSVEGDYTYLRLNFFVPGATMGRDQAGAFPESAQSGII